MTTYTAEDREFNAAWEAAIAEGIARARTEAARSNRDQAVLVNADNAVVVMALRSIPAARRDEVLAIVAA